MVQSARPGREFSLVAARTRDVACSHGVAELQRLRILEEEKGELKQLVADLCLGNKKMQQDVFSQKLFYHPPFAAVW